MESRESVLRMAAKIFRDNSPAWENAKIEFDGITQEEYYELMSANEDKAEMSHVLSRALEYVSKKIKGGTSSILNNSFVLDYDLRCNMDREAQYGTECLNISVPVNWGYRNVRVETVPGVLRDVLVAPELKRLITEGKVRNLNEFAGMVGLAVDEVRNSEASQSGKLLKVFQNGSFGQNKLTRLVKGCLLYLDHKETGPTEYRNFKVDPFEYNVANLVKALKHGDTAYVFSTSEGSNSANAILYSMCQEYPNPVMGGDNHIKIPADANDIFLVGHSVPDTKFRAVITAETIWGTLIQYADQFRLENDLEAALAIACTLRQNKYFDKVNLPDVISSCDLIYPALSKLKDGVTEKTIISEDAATLFGRIHQMMCLVLFKELDTSVYNTSSLHAYHDADMRAMMLRDSSALVNYMGGKTCADLLKLTCEMDWLGCLDDAQMHIMRNCSVFEGFWLISNPKMVMQNGVIRCLKKGYHHPVGIMKKGMYIDTFRTLEHEVELATGKRLKLIPSGGYNVGFACVRSPKLIKSKIKFGKTSEMVDEMEYYSGKGRRKINFTSKGEVPCPNGPLYREEIVMGMPSDSEGDSGVSEETEDEEKEKREKQLDDATSSSRVKKDDDKDKDGDGSKLARITEGEEKESDSCASSEIEEIPREEEPVKEKDGGGKETRNGRGAVTEIVLQPGLPPPKSGTWGWRVATVPVQISSTLAYFPSATGVGSIALAETEGTSGYRTPDESMESEGSSVVGFEFGKHMDDTALREQGDERTEGIIMQSGGVRTETVEFEPRGKTTVITRQVSYKSKSAIKKGWQRAKASMIRPFSPRRVTQRHRVMIGDELELRRMEAEERAKDRLEFEEKLEKEEEEEKRKREASRILAVKRELDEIAAGRAVSKKYLDIADLEDVTINEFCRGKGKHSASAEAWKKLLMCLPPSKFSNVRMGDVRTKYAEELYKYTRWSDELSFVRNVRVPDEYRQIFNRVLDKMDAEEAELVNTVTDNMVNLAQDDVVFEMAKGRNEWKGTTESDFLALNGAHQYHIGNEYWRKLAVKYFRKEVKDFHVFYMRDFKAFAEYLDQGGEIGTWQYIWGMCKNEEITEEMNWWYVWKRTKEIRSMWNSMKVKMRPKYASQEEAYEALHVGDSYSVGGKYMSKEDYNSAVAKITSMSISKQALMLAQLYVTGSVITAPEYYTIPFRNLVYTGELPDYEKRIRGLLVEQLLLLE